MLRRDAALPKLLQHPLISLWWQLVLVLGHGRRCRLEPL